MSMALMRFLLVAEGHRGFAGFGMQREPFLALEIVNVREPSFDLAQHRCPVALATRFREPHLRREAGIGVTLSEPLRELLGVA